MIRVRGPWFGRSIPLLCALTLLGACDYFRSPEGRVQQARELIEQGEHRRALVELKNALQKSPDLAEARLMLAETALWLGDPPAAEAELGKLQNHPDAARIADLRLRIDLALGRNAGVLAAASEASALTEPQRALYRGQALRALGKPQQAEAAFRETLAGDPGNVAALTGVAESLAAGGQLAPALEFSADVVEKSPDSALAWHSHGMLLARAGKLPEAEQALQRAAGLAARQLGVQQQSALLAALIEVQLANGNLAGARVSHGLLNGVAPGTPLVMLLSGRIAMAGNDFLTATTELRRVVNAAPRFVQARFMLGIALAVEGNLAQAAQELGTVVEQAPENLEARQLLAQVRIRQQDPDGALRVLVPAVLTDDDDSKLSALLENIQLPASDPRAVQALERALAASPQARSLQIQLASAYLQTGKPRQALELLRLGDAEHSAREAALLVQAVLRTEGLPAARARMKTALQHHPDDTPLRVLASAIETQAGDMAQARALLAEAIRKKPRDEALWFALAQVEWAARQPDAARAALEKLLALKPGHQLATLALAELESATGNSARSRQLLESLRAADANAVEPRLALMKLALRGDDNKLAQPIAEEILKSRPTDASVRQTIGMLYLGFGRFDQALAVMRDAAKLSPDDAVIWLNIGRVQSALGQTGPAAESFRKALTLRPGWIAATGALAFIELRDGDAAAAVQRVADLKRQYPRDAAVHALEGEVRLATREFSAAAAAFEQAYALEPSAGLAAKLYSVRTAGQLADPAEPLERWIRSHPDDNSLVSLLAEAYLNAGNAQAAIAQYQRLLELNPRHVPALNNIAWLYLQLRDARAVTFARKAVELAPDSAAVIDTLGWILVETGQTAEGLALLERAVGLPGATPDVRYHLAVALERAGRAAEAEQALTALLRDPQVFASRQDAERLQAKLRTAN